METNVNLIVKGPKDPGHLPHASLGKIILDSLRKHDQHKTCLVDGVTGVELSFGDVLEKTVKLATGLKLMGLKKNDTVAIVSENSVNYFIPLIACYYNGIIVTLLNPESTEYELKKYMMKSDVKMIFCSKMSVSKIMNLQKDWDSMKKLMLLDGSIEDNVMTLEMIYKLVDGDAEKFETEPVDPHTQTGLLMYSSGTSGLPKGVLLTHENLRITIFKSGPGYLDACDSDTMVYTLPCFHIVHVVPFFACFIYGSKLVVLPKFKPEQFLSNIEKYRANKMIIVPALVLFMVKSPLVPKYNLQSLKLIYTCSAPITQDLLSIFEKNIVGCRVRSMYGLTESAGALTMNPASSNYLDSVGKLTVGVDAKVLGVDGQLLGPDQVGELCFKGTNMTRGYANNEQATKEAIDDDEFFHTGDVGYYNQEGYFFVVDRIKDIIKFKGYQVSPTEVETVLLLNPEVREAGVVGIPDERAGEMISAFAVKMPKSQMTEKELFDFSSKFLSPYKLPKGGINFVDEIPKNAMGKIDRKKLKNLWHEANEIQKTKMDFVLRNI
ncbi:PREDICTED: luciferin 4-monooxygenase-like [Nicrophorus vespilloides]|uniref:Luciferin 4-monooxygenase n=1 Tax=Nicrophorus vespilloides TaxID=110193 RepID=A0ABM1NIV3_NICVS|nr:PREDICTED: luciferin 4-monooxygenase-like [Nicrophorus vespilloides]XP_017786753.1 PREDICTED: luciferin 4-monooxygenase-like [Nicrophorus vespilloides]